MFDIQNIIDACGKIESRTANGTRCGTGYLVGETQVATCWHVVEGAASDGITIDFRGSRVQVDVGPTDHQADCALLILRRPQAGTKPLQIGGECKWKAVWDGYGYPLLARGTGITIEGVVRNPKATDDLDAPAIELFSPDVAAGMAAPLHGYSGSPVVVNGVVVGHLKRFPADPGDPARAAMGKVWATRSECILSLLATLPGNGLPPSPGTLELPEPGSQDARDAVVRVQSLLAKWQDDPNASKEAAGWTAAESLIQLGEPEQALFTLTNLPSSLRTEQLQALALAKTDNPSNIDRAVEILTGLRQQGHLDPETSGILGGRFKQLWHKKGERKYLDESFEVYRDAFERTQDTYPGINAAALALWRNERSQSVEIANKVLRQLDQTPTERTDFWHMATKGEAYLLANDIDRSRLWYEAAARKCGYASESVQTMRRQARLNLRALGLSEDALDASFKAE